MKITNHHNLRRRVQIDCSEPVLTDQSYKKASDINNIMKQYQKTGVLPVTQQKIARYVDNSNIPSLEEAHNIIKEAKELFYQIPSNIRKLMDNDPTKLVDFLQNAENKDILIKEGVLIKAQESLLSEQPAVAQQKQEVEPQN